VEGVKSTKAVRKLPKIVQRRTNFEFYSHTERRKSGLLTIRSTLQVIILRFYTPTTHDPKATFDLSEPAIATTPRGIRIRTPAENNPVRFY
jgi:hypothetical protein